MNKTIQPMMSTCVYCGELKSEILLLETDVDAEIPRQAVTGYEPCDECKEQQKDYVRLVCVSDEPVDDNQMPIDVHGGVALYPNELGWMLVKNRAFKDIFGELPEGGLGLVDEGMFNQLKDMAKEAEENDI